MRAAQQQAADISTTQQRLVNQQAAELAQQRQEEMTSKYGAELEDPGVEGLGLCGPLERN